MTANILTSENYHLELYLYSIHKLSDPHRTATVVFTHSQLRLEISLFSSFCTCAKQFLLQLDSWESLEPLQWQFTIHVSCGKHTSFFMILSESEFWPDLACNCSWLACNCKSRLCCSFSSVALTALSSTKSPRRFTSCACHLQKPSC